MNTVTISLILNIFTKLLWAHLLFLLLMTLFRTVFFFFYLELETFEAYYFDIFSAFFLGMRIDLTVIGYVQVLPTLFLIALYYLKKKFLLELFSRFLPYYLFIFYTLITLLLSADFGFYSYFKDHTNILFFGLLDDDTNALITTFWQNYNVVLILTLFAIYLAALFIALRLIFQISNREFSSLFGIRTSWIIFLLFILLNAFAIRGTLGMYPLGKMIPNISTNDYINKIPQNGVRAFVSAYEHRKKFLQSHYDLIKETGYENNIEAAFEVHKQTKEIVNGDLLKNISYKTAQLDTPSYNVVVIMVESFGMPILNYQSEDFNILGALKKHFDEDILFTNFISEGDGTISSLESLLLNIPYRPNSFAFSQSVYKQTSFDYSAAFLYAQEGYNTSFIYGGDLSWRNLGEFVKYQGYAEVAGKINIFNALSPTKPKDDYFHPWGIYDEHLYDYILNKLEKSKQKEFVVALSTNNHPPYNIPNDYNSKRLLYSETLKKHIIGDFDLAQQRFRSFAYALDQVGIFLDKFKASTLKENTIVVITADNNTVDGIMKYDENQLLNSKNIPLYFYIPKRLKEQISIDTKVAGSHKDIFPTLYNLTLANKTYLSIGSNLFDSTQPHYGFNGSMIVNRDNEIRKLQRLNEKTEDDLIEYYKATLAVTQYLIDKTQSKK